MKREIRREEARRIIKGMHEARENLLNSYEQTLKEKYPLITSEAYYEDAITEIIGENGFRRLRLAKRLECCGSIEGYRLYVLR